jgi:CRP-like cAMP-binding protein
MGENVDPRRNLILGGLPEREFAELENRLEVIDVEVRHNVYQPSEPITEVFFPLDSVFSLIAVADDRAVVEVATIGREGMVGLPLFLGANSSPHPAFCQVAGAAVSLSADHFRQALAFDGGLHKSLRRLAQATMVQIAQNVVCNGTHTTEQRAARWLLTTRDRVARDEFSLTQEFLGQMLGVRRPTVSEIAARLQADGLIRYTRGQLVITDPQRLRKASCECYAVVKAEFDALKGRG